MTSTLSVLESAVPDILSQSGDVELCTRIMADNTHHPETPFSGELSPVHSACLTGQVFHLVFPEIQLPDCGQTTAMKHLK